MDSGNKPLPEALLTNIYMMQYFAADFTQIIFWYCF